MYFLAIYIDVCCLDHSLNYRDIRTSSVISLWEQHQDYLLAFLDIKSESDLVSIVGGRLKALLEAIGRSTPHIYHLT
jgi:hypothetical protein